MTIDNVSGLPVYDQWSEFAHPVPQTVTKYIFIENKASRPIFCLEEYKNNKLFFWLIPACCSFTGGWGVRQIIEAATIMFS